MDRNQWLSLIAPVALKMESLFGTPAHVMVAHSAVECGWGAAIIGQHNHFGITAAERHTLNVMRPTKEVLSDDEARWWKAKYPGRPLNPVGSLNGKTVYSTVRPFADYPTLEDGARDWVAIVTGERGGGKRINGRLITYQSAWLQFRATSDWKAWAQQYLQIYATAGKADLVIRIAEQRNVINAIEAAA